MRSAYTLHIFELLTNQQQQQQMAYGKRSKKNPYDICVEIRECETLIK